MIDDRLSVIDCDIEDVDWLCVTGLFVGVVYDDADDDDAVSKAGAAVRSGVGQCVATAIVAGRFRSGREHDGVSGRVSGLRSGVLVERVCERSRHRDGDGVDVSVAVGSGGGGIVPVLTRRERERSERGVS